MKLNLLFIFIDLLILLAYPIVFVLTKLPNQGRKDAP